MTVRFDTWRYYLAETRRGLARNAYMSLASVATVAVSLLVLATVLIAAANLEHVSATIQSQVEMVVYLKDGLSQQQKDVINNGLKSLAGVAEVTYVSKDDALSQLEQQFGDQKDMLEGIRDINPLQDSFQVRFVRPQDVPPAAQQAQGMDGVDSVYYEQQVVDRLARITTLLRVLGLGAVALLAFGTVFIISNTIRLAVFARRYEVRVMKLVGATDWFIRWPFILEGMALGFAGAVLTSVLVYGLYTWIAGLFVRDLPFVPVVKPYPFVWHLSVILAAGGALLGMIGSAISLRRFLQV